jgi:peptidoglycan/LPS O-acetylase OafA/YrhL
MNTSESSPTLSSQRNPGIDLLRGISIVLVVIHHVSIRIPLKNGILATFLPSWLINALVHNGYEAVFIFFVISGFLIASNSLKRWGDLAHINANSFYLRRASRILPCLLLLLAVLSFLHLVGAPNYVISHSNQSLPRAILAALGLHLNWYEGHTGYLPASWDVLWSLSIEEVFYLAFPLVCLVLRLDWLLVSALALLTLSLPFTRAALSGNELMQEKAYLPGMAAIATGILGALISSRFSLHNRRWLSFLQAAAILGILVVLLFKSKVWKVMGDGCLLVLTVSTVCLLLSFYWQQEAKLLRPIPGIRWLQSFGILSYEVYLTHMFMVWFVVGAFKATGASLRWGFLWYFPALISSWALGWLVAKYISVPAERLVRRQAITKMTCEMQSNSI